MIPDKIYIRHYWMPEELDDEWRPKPVEDEQCEEYIRKEALLEWAKETYLTEKASAIRKVCFKQLVDKLMSM